MPWHGNCNIRDTKVTGGLKGSNGLVGWDWETATEMVQFQDIFQKQMGFMWEVKSKIT